MKGFCCKTCGGCNTIRGEEHDPTIIPIGAIIFDEPLSDIPPNNDHSCKEQAKWGKCGEKFMKGYCKKSCSSKVGSSETGKQTRNNANP